MSDLIEGGQYLIKNRKTGQYLTGKPNPDRAEHGTVELQPLREGEARRTQLWELRQGNAQGRFMLRNMERRQTYLHPAGHSGDASTLLEEFVYEPDHADSYMWEVLNETTPDGEVWKLKCVVGGRWLNVVGHSHDAGAQAEVYDDDSETHAYRQWMLERVPSTKAGTGVELPLAFSVPEEFLSLDFAASAEENTNLLLARLGTLERTPSQEELAHAVLAQQTMYEMLTAAGAVYAGVLLAKPPAGAPPEKQHLSSLILSVIARPSELANEHTVTRLARTLGAIHPEAEVGVSRLPSGPVVLLTQDSKVEKPVNLLANDDQPTVVRQLHVFVPIPGRLAMADFSIATENLAEWDHCVDILAGVCSTIAFT
ncbi:RICIN domain-containing protein [Streptomyces violens]|uniref:RICIN domain-containing protein n=1 Tax=Streptomyces violens TaxID=66377 RepID=UPI0004C14B7B|nr:RICIN domain-containing protein [Streptomyces violens]